MQDVQKHGSLSRQCLSKITPQKMMHTKSATIQTSVGQQKADENKEFGAFGVPML